MCLARLDHRPKESAISTVSDTRADELNFEFVHSSFFALDPVQEEDHASMRIQPISLLLWTLLGVLIAPSLVKDVASLLNSICNSFKCGGPEMRVAMVTFGSTVVTEFDFAYSARYHRSRQSIVDKVKETKYTDGMTATSAALEHV